MTIYVSNEAAIAGLDALLAVIGSGGSLKIYDGSVPADCDASIGASTLLAELPLSSTPFGGATDGTGVATADAATITADASADATGTATYGRFCKSDGTAVIQGAVGTSGAQINLNTVSIVSGGPVSMTSFTMNLSETGA